MQHWGVRVYGENFHQTNGTFWCSFFAAEISLRPAALSSRNLHKGGKTDLAAGKNARPPLSPTRLSCGTHLPLVVRYITAHARRRVRRVILFRSKPRPPSLAERTVTDARATTTFPPDTVRQEKIVQAGSVPAIIALSVREGVDVTSQRRCVAALLNLARAPANIARMVEVCVQSTTTA